MNNIYSFWEFLKENNIEVPKIQRDYAQGRAEETDKREKFLKNIKEALVSKEPLMLDFVYGARTNHDRLILLDGQQRITTLWLLHWFVAYKTNNLKDNASTFKHLSYETRRTARNFTRYLCEKPLCNDKETDDEPLSELIKKQNWYLNIFSLDPTVQGMIRMLSNNGEKDSIEKVFGGTDLEEIWDRLTKDNLILFNFKDMSKKNTLQTDDLYIKMNSRGRQLTDFENFKAEFFGYKVEGNNYFDVENNKDDSEFIKNFENSWTSLFWKYHHKTKYVIDGIFMAFINCYAINFYIENAKLKATEKDEKLNALLGTSEKFKGIEVYKPVLTQDFKKDFAYTLNAIVKAKTSNGNLNLDDFFPQYKSDDATDLSVKETSFFKRAIFFGVCKYFETLQNGTYNEQHFEDWCRFVKNLTYNPEVTGLQGLINVIKPILSFSTHCLDIIAYLNSLDPEKTYSDIAKPQIKEEIEKAKEIVLLRTDCDDDNDFTEADIHEAEDFSFFHGAIRFLFHDAENKICWKGFSTKWNKCKSLFKDDKNEIVKINVLRNFIYRVSDWNTLMNKTLRYDSKEYTWRAILLSEEMSVPVEQLLTKDTLSDEELKGKNSPFTDNIQNRVHKELYGTLLLDNTTWQPFTLHEGGPFVLIPDGCWATYKKYYVGNPGNYLLCQALKEGKISLNDPRQKFQNCDFFWGDKIDFNYKDYHFTWYNPARKINNNYNDKDLYLMKVDDSGWDYFTRDNPTDKYIDRNLEGDNPKVEDLYSALDSMIEEFIKK